MTTPPSDQEHKFLELVKRAAKSEAEKADSDQTIDSQSKIQLEISRLEIERLKAEVGSLHKTQRRRQMIAYFVNPMQIEFSIS